MTLPDNVLGAAVSAAQRGWYVTPFRVTLGANGKKHAHGCVRWSEPVGRSNDSGQVRDWWVQYPDAVIGILTKESDLIVIDLDLHDPLANGLEAWLDLCGKYAGGELPETYTVTTPTGGMHLYFRCTDVRIKNSASKLAPGVDVRGGGDKSGGIVFGAGSVRYDGRYEVANDVPVADLPEWLARLLLPVVIMPAVSLFDESDRGHDGKWTQEQAEREWDRCDAVVLASKGEAFNAGINDLGFRYGRFVAGGFLTADEAYARCDAVSIALWSGQLADGNEVTARNAIRDGAAKGEPFELIKAKKKRKPLAPEFTDASMAEFIAGEVLDGKFVHCESLGPWLEWNGKFWERTDIGSAIEAVRIYAKKKYLDVVKAEGIGCDNAKGWARYNSARSLSSLVSLAGNALVKARPEDFDTHEDLINTPDGVLNLRTFVVGPHDPSLLLTKMTNANFRPGETSEHFQALLGAVPEDSRRWLQVHMGQGVSGRSKGRTPAILLTGVGNNGKSLLMQTTLRALGGIRGTSYAALVPNELLLAGKGAGGPSPEKMMLRGTRFAYVEETPEGRYLDVERMKQVVGTGVITARYLHKDLVTFEMTHVLFINTNYPPRVAETDTATWRRLTALRFPNRYRLDNDGLGARVAGDVDGDPELERNLLEQKGIDALFTWMVEGLQLGAAHEVAMPASVETSIREWRKEADALLRFFDDEIVFDADSWLPTQTLVSVLKVWARRENISNIGNAATLGARIEEHTALAGKVTRKKIRTSTPGFEPPKQSVWLAENARDAVVVPTGAWAHAFVGVRLRREGE